MGGDRRARAEAVDPDATGGVLQGEGVGEVLHAALGDRVAHEPGLGDHLVDAGDVDDRTAGALVEEVPHGLLGAEERAAQVDRE